MGRDAPERGFGALVGGGLVVGVYEAGADEQNIPDTHIASLRFWTEVDTLSFCHLLQLCDGNGMVIIGIVLDPIRLSIPPIIDQNATRTNSMITPVVDGAVMLVLPRTIDMLRCGAVVELRGGDVRDVAEAVPLRPGLGVQNVEVVVGEGWDKRLDEMLEGFAAEAGNEGLVKREAAAVLVLHDCGRGL